MRKSHSRTTKAGGHKTHANACASLARYFLSLGRRRDLCIVPSSTRQLHLDHEPHRATEHVHTSPRLWPWQGGTCYGNCCELRPLASPQREYVLPQPHFNCMNHKLYMHSIGRGKVVMWERIGRCMSRLTIGSGPSIVSICFVDLIYIKVNEFMASADP